MTLSDLLAVWSKRYSLSDRERLALAESVALTIDLGKLASGFSPMPVEVAAKLGVRSWREAARRFVLERLVGDDSNVPEPPPTQPRPEPPVPAQAPPPKSRLAERLSARRCNFCQKHGHNSQTCPEFRGSGAR